MSDTKINDVLYNMPSNQLGRYVGLNFGYDIFMREFFFQNAFNRFLPTFPNYARSMICCIIELHEDEFNACVEDDPNWEKFPWTIVIIASVFTLLAIIGLVYVFFFKTKKGGVNENKNIQITVNNSDRGSVEQYAPLD